MTKVYARQVPPPDQESPLFCEGLPEGLEIAGNRRLCSYTSDLFDRLPDILEDLADAWESFCSGCPTHYDTWADALADLVTPEGRPEYTREERKKDWPELMADFQAWGAEQATIEAALTLITGHQWDSCTLRGCCQSEWQDCLYRADLWDGPALERLEMEYFNTGSEWHIYEDDDCCCSVYCYEWSDDGIRREIADAAGVEPEAVTLYKFTGYAQIAQYEEV